MGYVQQITTQATEIGGKIAATLRPSLDWRARARSLGAALDGLRAAEERDFAALVDKLAAGTVEPSVLASGVGATWSFGSGPSEAVVRAVATAHERADRAVTEAGPALLAAMQAEVAGLVAESVKLVAKMPRQVTSAASAFQAAREHPEVPAAWARCGELIEVWGRIHELYRVLLLSGVAPDAPDHLLGVRGRVVPFTKFERPEVLPAGFGGVAAELQLAQAKAAGAEPGVYAWPDAYRRHQRWAVNANRQDQIVDTTPHEVVSTGVF